MNSLQTIQKIFRVFQILTKIAFVFTIVEASICAVGVLCTAAWYNGGQVFCLFGEPVTVFNSGEELNQVLAVQLSNLILLAVDAFLLGFAGRYFKIERAEGTPFTKNGAELLKKLGIRCIWMPIVAVVIASVITVCLGAESGGDISNLSGLVTGIVLILASLIFQYGAELEQRDRADITEAES